MLADDAVQITETLDPFETIGLVFLSPPANDILGSVGTGKVIPLPAIAYHCYDTKAWTNAEQKTAIDIVQLASVAVAIGEIQSARQAWRVWLAWGDLAVNAPDFVLKNEQVRQQILALPGGGEFLFYWDRCVLIANGVYLSPFAFQFAKGLVSSSVRLSSQLPEIVGKQWQDVNNLFTKLDEGYELGLVGKVAKGGSITKTLKLSPSWKSDRAIIAVEGKTTTLIGSYGNDTRRVLEELKYPKSTNFGPRNGDFNLLNVPDEYFNPTTFWDDFNKPWLKAATDRGDEIIVLSNKYDNSLLLRNGEITGFGREIQFMDELVKTGKYRYIEETGKYIPNN